MLLYQAEHKLIGYDHQIIGEALLTDWKYPPVIAFAAGYHHHPQNTQVGQTEALVVHVADHIVHAMHIGSSGERYVPPLKSHAWSTLNLQHSFLENLLRGIDEQIDSAREMFLWRR